uniref:L-seryl-tRNA(Sec) kinase (inferred by orthology to a human protein) n=1 Tax=Strongyloides venezuelensis TaxID=75913 RepID=A0A0K0FL43_STRVS
MALFLICGIPGSGKSYFCNLLIAKINNIKYYSFDDFIQTNSQFRNDDCRNNRIKWENYVKKDIEESEFDMVIVEDNFWFKSMRKPFVKFAKRLNIQIGIINFNISLNICLERNSHRCGKQKINEETIVKLFHNNDINEDDKKYYDYFIEINSNTNITDVLDFIIKLKIDKYLKNNKKSCDTILSKSIKNANDEREEILRKSISILIKEGYNYCDLKVIKDKMKDDYTWNDCLATMRTYLSND